MEEGAATSCPPHGRVFPLLSGPHTDSSRAQSDSSPAQSGSSPADSSPEQKEEEKDENIPWYELHRPVLFSNFAPSTKAMDYDLLSCAPLIFNRAAWETMRAEFTKRECPYVDSNALSIG